MAGLGWLFAWAKENGIELPLEENGSVDIQKLLELYDEWRGRGKEEPQEKQHDFPKAQKFNRLNTAHHQRHAKEMGFKNLKEYEKAAVNFFNSDRGQLYYSTKWEKFYRYDKTTQELAVSSGGVVHTFWKRTLKEFERIRRQDKLDEL